MANYGSMWWNADVKNWVTIANTSEPDTQGEATAYYGPLPTMASDVTNPTIDIAFLDGVGIPTNLAVQAIQNSYDIVVSSTAGLAIGAGILIAGIDTERFSTFRIINIIGVTVTLDRPMDYAYAINSPVIRITNNMIVNGAVTPVTFSIFGGEGDSLLTLDITRIILKIITTAAPDLTMFGDIVGGLTRGVQFRICRSDGTIRNLFNIKTNGDMVNLAFDLNIYDALKFGVHGISMRLSFGGLDKHGAVIRLKPGDVFECIIQDDLTSLLEFRIAGEGHIASEK